MEKLLTESEKIEHQNALIAEFMGYERYEDSQGVWFKKEGLIMSMHPKLEDLKYHSEWNWLMEVVEKIENLFHGGLQVYIKDKRAYIEIDTQASLVFDLPEVPQCYSGFCETKREAVYDTVLRFIEWHKSHLATTQPSPQNQEK